MFHPVVLNNLISLLQISLTNINKTKLIIIRQTLKGNQGVLGIHQQKLKTDTERILKKVKIQLDKNLKIKKINRNS